MYALGLSDVFPMTSTVTYIRQVMLPTRKRTNGFALLAFFDRVTWCRHFPINQNFSIGVWSESVRAWVCEWGVSVDTRIDKWYRCFVCVQALDFLRTNERTNERHHGQLIIIVSLLCREGSILSPSSEQQQQARVVPSGIYLSIWTLCWCFWCDR